MDNSNHKDAALAAPRAKRVALYTRISYKELLKGKYPDCSTQVGELLTACQDHEWSPVYLFQDHSYGARQLDRPGLEAMLALAREDQIDIVLCTWRDRLSRSHDFIEIAKKLKASNVEIVTLYEPDENATACGRFMDALVQIARNHPGGIKSVAEDNRTASTRFLSAVMVAAQTYDQEISRGDVSEDAG